MVWHQVFWNDKLERVYSLGGLPEAALPLATVAHAGRGGRLIEPDGRPLRERYVVAAKAVELEGTGDRRGAGRERRRVAALAAGAAGPSALDPHGRARGRRHARARRDARLGLPERAGCQLTLLPKLSSQVELKVNGQHVRTIRFHGEEYVNTTVFPPPGADLCRFEVIPDSLLGSTQFQFVRN